MSLAAPCSSRLSRSTSSSSHSTPRLDRGEDVNGICTKGRYPRSGFHSWVAGGAADVYPRSGFHSWGAGGAAEVSPRSGFHSWVGGGAADVYPCSHSSARCVGSHVGVLVVHEVVEAAVRAGIVAVAGADLLARLVLPLLVRHVGALAGHRFEVVEWLTRFVAVLLGAIPVLVTDRDPAGAVLLDGGGGGGFLEVAVVALPETDLHGRPHIAWRILSFPSKPGRNASGQGSWLVDAPDVTKCVADLTDRRASPQRVAHRIQHVVVALCGAPQRVEPPRDVVAGAVRAQGGQPLGLVLLDRRVHAQRLVALVGRHLVAVDPNDDTRARLDLLRGLVRRLLDLALLEAALDRGDGAAHLLDRGHQCSRC